MHNEAALHPPGEGKHPHWALAALAKLEGWKLLVRQTSTTDEAKACGEGFLFFTHPDGQPFPTISGAYLVRAGLVVPQQDGLLDGVSQTFRCAA